MAGLTGSGILLPGFGNTGMAAGAFGVTLIHLMTSQTTHVDIEAVHGFLKRYLFTLFGALQGVALNTGV